MRKQLVFVSAVYLATLSHLAYAQSSPGDLTGQASSQTASPMADCSDPLMANSSQCTPGGDNATGTLDRGDAQTQPYGSQQGLSGARGAATIGPAIQNQNYNDNGGLGNQSQNGNAQRRQRLPPEPLTEFQKFVVGTTGVVLPVYGANLFQDVPSTYAPLDQSPVPPDYIIGPGDELRIRIWGQVNFNANVRVDRSGQIYLPQVGPVHVAGLPIQLLDQHLHAAVGRIYRNFELSADIGQIRSLQVYVVGQAHRPGTYTISSLSTLVDALFASGGPSMMGSMRHILLKRGGETVADFDLYDLIANGDKSKDAKLQSGDVIFIPAVGSQVAFTGSVRRPGIYEIRDETTIAQLLKYAGGATAVAAGGRISIERIQDHKDRAAMEVAFDAEGLATRLRDGDILRIYSILPAYQKTVTLRGNTANPGRFAWHEGMRLSDLIPDKQSLITRDYWWKRAQLGLPSLEFEPVPLPAAQSQPTNPVDLRTRARYYPQIPAECLSRYSNLPACAAYDRTNPGNRSLQQQQYGPDFSGGIDQGDLSPDQAQQQQQNSNYDRPSANQQASSGSLASLQSSMQTQNTAGGAQRTTVKLSAPEIDWDYAVIERLDPETLRTSLIPFDLGKLVINHDPSQNLEIHAGDVVSVFSQADIHIPVAQQTKFVRLEGEFVHAGTYSVQPGETLPQLIARAGGLTSDAYLYGSQFTRESTRVAQQQRIDEYVQTLQLSIARGTLSQASVATSSAQDIASASAAAESGRELVSRLGQIRATGRMVLEVKPDSTGIAALPDLQLEDGDRFTVPSRPANVNVVGAVYDQNSFVYVTGRGVGDYLALAGGPNRDADRKHAFVIRADGSVLSRGATSGIWGNTFDAQAMNPGDTLVVPEKTYRPSALRGVLEWSQLFSSLALGVAAISVIQ